MCVNSCTPAYFCYKLLVLLHMWLFLVTLKLVRMGLALVSTLQLDSLIRGENWPAVLKTVFNWMHPPLTGCALTSYLDYAV